MYAYLKRKAKPIPPNVLLAISFVILLGIFGGLLYWHFNKPPVITDFESCVKAGQPVLESDPVQCTYNGQSFISPTEHVPKPDYIN